MSTRLETKIVSILHKKPTSFWGILEELDSGESETILALKKLFKKKKIIVGKKIKLVRKEKKEVLDASNPKVFKKFLELTKKLNPLNDSFYQERVLIKDIIKKLSFVDLRGDLFESDIVFLGDDDFASIAVMLTKKPRSITVLEIDPEIIRIINQISKEFEKKGYPKIRCIQTDLSKPLNPKLRNKFDVFVCEPPEAINGMESFISKGIALLRGNGCAGYVGITRIESSGKKWHAIQKKLVKSNAFVSDALRRFEAYPLFSEDETDLRGTPLYKKLFFDPGKQNADWWNAALVRIELIDKPKPFTPTKGNFFHDKETLSVEETIGL